MLKIIYHSLGKRWVQSLATLATVAISVGILFSLYWLYQGVTLGISTGEKRLGADMLVVPTDAAELMATEELLFTGAPVCIYMNKEYEARISRLDGVNQVTSQFFTQTLDAACCSAACPTRIIGFDPGTDWALKAWAGELRNNSLGANEILVGGAVIGFTGSNTYILGQKVHIAAVLAPTGTSLDQSILLPIALARKMAREKPELQHFWKQYGDPDQLVSAILVDVDECKRTEVMRAISKMGDLKVIQSLNVLQSVKQQLDTVFFIMLGGGILATAASIFQLFARFFSLAWDRKGEWGLYRALGATRRDIKILVIGEALALTVGGTVLGFPIGGGLYCLIRQLLTRQQDFPFLSPSVPMILLGMAAITLLFILIGFVSAWFPARQSGKIEPSSAMALGDID